MRRESPRRPAPLDPHFHHPLSHEATGRLKVQKSKVKESEKPLPSAKLPLFSPTLRPATLRPSTIFLPISPFHQFGLALLALLAVHPSSFEFQLSAFPISTLPRALPRENDISTLAIP